MHKPKDDALLPSKPSISTASDAASLQTAPSISTARTDAPSLFSSPFPPTWPEATAAPRTPATPRVKAVLENHNVRFKQLLDRELPQAPSQRLLPNTFAFPGSRSDFNHVLFVTETKPNTLLAVAYSKNTVQTGIGQEEKEAMLLKMLELNAAEPLTVWKLEERWESLFPVLEEAIMQRERSTGVRK
jgi:hypothetical protein